MDFAEHELLRCQAARQGYIAWRMQDLPSVYQQLLPLSYTTKLLWEAERAIRAQYKADQEFGARPWWHIGPPCRLLDHSGMTGTELIQFDLEITAVTGMPAVVKPGHHDHPEVKAAEERLPEQPVTHRRPLEWEQMRKLVAEAKAPEEKEALVRALEEKWGGPGPFTLSND